MPGALVALGPTRAPARAKERPAKASDARHDSAAASGTRRSAARKATLGMFWPDRSRSGREAALPASDAHDRWAKTSLRATLRSNEALHRARQHEQVWLTVRRIVLDDLLRRDGNPLLADP